MGYDGIFVVRLGKRIYHHPTFLWRYALLLDKTPVLGSIDGVADLS
jgi:hypothetical protein